MRNVLLMGVNWNSPCGALSRWCGTSLRTCAERVRERLRVCVLGIGARIV